MRITAGDLTRLVTLAPGFWRFLRHTVSVEEAREVLARRLAARETNFLRLLRDAVYANPSSPYLHLLRWADCEYGDVERMVRTQGLEPALDALHGAGVYVTFEEFKGRVPVVRNGRSFSPDPADFNNPLAGRPYFYGRTGGSTGAAVQLPLTWEHHRDQSVNILLAEHAQGLTDAPLAFWIPSPDTIIIPATVEMLSYGKAPAKWFTPPRERPPAWPLSRRAFVWYFVVAGRLSGARLPTPEPVGRDQAIRVARWAARTRDEHGTAVVYGYVSQMLRLAVAAAEAGLDLTGVTLSGGGEPPTPAKIKTVRSTGARWVPSYYSDQIGIGFACAEPADENDLHFQRDRLALIQRPQPVPGSDLTVDAFCFTSLLTSVPKILLNAETDDYGLVETRSCGCLLEEYGLPQHLRHIRSYRKLTGEGITLVGGHLEHVLEDVLPARFGGSALDYQFAEEEDEAGHTRMSVVVDPRLSIDEEHTVVDTVLRALEGLDAGGATTAAVWRNAGTLRVVRREPVRTGAGKLMPLHVSQPARSSGDGHAR